MDYRNADGSIAEACGNGIRVFARYLVAAGLVDAGRMVIGTRSGPREVTVPADGGGITAEMGTATGSPTPRSAWARRRGRHKLRKHTHAMSFDEIYAPGLFYDGSQTDRTLDGYVAQIFSGAAGGPPAPAEASDAAAQSDPSDPDAAPPPAPRRTTACCPRRCSGALPGTR